MKGIDDFTITFCGDPRSKAAGNLRALVELAIVNLGGSCKCDGRLVSVFDLHGAHIVVQQRARLDRVKKKRRRA